MAPRLHIILSASMTIVAAAGGLYALGYRRGLDLGQRLRRLDPCCDQQVGGVVVPIRRRA
jgi:hypothetical protein